MTTVAELLITALADHGVTQVWGVVGDALNPVTDAIRREDRIEWIGVRHEEAGAFAASAQAQLTGRLGGLHGHRRARAPSTCSTACTTRRRATPRCWRSSGRCRARTSAATSSRRSTTTRCSPTSSVFCQTVTSVDQLPLADRAGRSTPRSRSRASPSSPCPATSAGSTCPSTPPSRASSSRPRAPSRRTSRVRAAADAINAGGPVTLLVGQGARDARDEVMALAERLNAPMVLTLKAKEGFDDDNPYEVGQSGLIGNHATAIAFEGCDTLVMLGTDFPYRDFLPDREDSRPARRARRPHRPAYAGHAPARRRRRLGLQALLPLVDAEARHRTPGEVPVVVPPLAASGSSSWPTRRTSASRRVCCAARSTTPSTGSAPSWSRRPSTGWPPPTRSSPPTPAWPRSGSPASCG